MSFFAVSWSSPTEAKLSVEDYAIIGEALHAAEMEEWPRASRLMGTIDDPLASKLFQWMRLIEGPDEPGFDTFAAFIINNPDWPRLDDLQATAEARLTDSARQGLDR